MVRLYFEPEHKVLMAEFFGAFTMADVTYVDDLIAAFMAGRSYDIPGIVDFSGVERFDITSEQISGRAQKPQPRPSQRRIFVATKAEAYGICRMFAAFQAAHRIAEPEIVRTMQEAYVLLGLDGPRFEPVSERAVADGPVDEVNRTP
jgi:hypothetical protein